MSRILVKVGGVATALSAALVVVQEAWEVAAGGALSEGRGESTLHTLQLLLLVPGVIGLYLAQQHAMRAFGQIATLVALIGSALMFGTALTEVTILPELGATRSPLVDEPGAWMIGSFVAAFALWTAGLLLIGVATWRAGVLPRPAAVLLVVGVVVGFALSGFVPGVLTVYAAGLGWLGIAAATRPATATATAPQPVPAVP